jgi:hypothetical protein
MRASYLQDTRMTSLKPYQFVHLIFLPRCLNAQIMTPRSTYANADQEARSVQIADASPRSID